MLLASANWTGHRSVPLLTLMLTKPCPVVVDDINPVLLQLMLMLIYLQCEIDVDFCAKRSATG